MSQLEAMPSCQRPTAGATMYSVREWLREARRSRGDGSLREFAAGSQFGTGYLSGLECGRGAPNIQSIKPLAALYGVDALEMAARFMDEQPIEVPS